MQSRTLNCPKQNGVRLVCARLNFVAPSKMPSCFYCFPICFSLPDNCDRFQVPLQGIFGLKVLWRVISSSAVRMGRSILTAAWRVNSSWIFFIWINKTACFLEKMTLHCLFFHWNIAKESSCFFFVQKNGGTQQRSKVNWMIHYHLLNHLQRYSLFIFN